MTFYAIQNGQLVPVQTVGGEQMGQLAQIAAANNQPQQPSMGATMGLGGAQQAQGGANGSATQGAADMLGSFMNGYYQQQARQQGQAQQQDSDPFGGKGTNAANPHLSSYQGFDPFADNDTNTTDPFGGSGTVSPVAQALSKDQGGIDG